MGKLRHFKLETERTCSQEKIVYRVRVFSPLKITGNEGKELEIDSVQTPPDPSQPPLGPASSTAMSTQSIPAFANLSLME